MGDSDRASARLVPTGTGTNCPQGKVIVIDMVQIPIKMELDSDCEFEISGVAMDSKEVENDNYPYAEDPRQTFTRQQEGSFTDPGNFLPSKVEESIIEYMPDDANVMPMNDSLPKRNLRPTRKPTQKFAEFLCRICEHASPLRLVNIFGAKGKLLKLADKIHFFLPIIVKETDKLPHGVCVSCIKALDVCDNLYQKCLSTDSHLREVFLKEDLSQFHASEINTIDLKKRSKTLVEAIHEAEKSVPYTTNNEDAPPIGSEDGECGELEDCNGDADNEGGEVGHATDSSNLESDEDGSKNEETKICDLCPEKFRTGADLSRHRKTHSAEERLRCKECGKMFPNDASYASHIRLHKEPPVQCEVCEAVVANRMYLRRHMLIHEPPKFCCTVCGKTARDMPKLMSHMVSHSEERPFTCGTCGQKFKTFATLRQHEAIHSDTPTHVCDICGRAFHRKNHLDRHVKAHNDGTYKRGITRLTCGICTLTYTSDENLKKHYETAHGGEAVPHSALNAHCEICDKDFPSRSSLRVHKSKVHGLVDNSGYKCPMCGVKLKSARTLNYHILIHTGEKPFQCKICGMTFRAPEQRDSHERKHSGERPFKCRFCGKSFLGYATMYQHQAIHTAEKKHKCDMCPYKTHRPAALRIHLLSHTGEKPYHCTLCSKAYRASWDLTLHIRAVHNGETVPRRIRRRPKKRSDGAAVSSPTPNTEESCNSDSVTISVMQL